MLPTMPESTNQCRRLRSLLSLACDGVLTSENRRELEQLLQGNFEQLAGEYFDFLTIDALLRDPSTLRRLQQRINQTWMEEELERTSEAAAPPATPTPAPPRSSDSPHRQIADQHPRVPWAHAIWRAASALPNNPRALAAAGLAAALLLAIGVWQVGGFDRHATIVSVESAQWSDSRDRDVGNSLDGDWVQLDAGVVRLLFVDEAQATIHGPAKFRTLTGNSVELDFGELAVYAPPKAHGFRVVGDGYVVTDLGTSFRLKDAQDADVQLRVTQGSVELQHHASAQTRTMKAGSAVLFGEQAPPQKLESRSAVDGTSGGVEFIASHPRSLGYGRFRKDGRLAAFLERTGVELQKPVLLDIAASGRHSRFEVGQLAPAGTVVDVYLLHFAPKKRRGRATGAIRFDHPIVGVICDSNQLNATNSALGADSTLRCQHPERGLEPAPNPNSDVVTLSADRRTLKIACQAESIDQLRVLVGQ